MPGAVAHVEEAHPRLVLDAVAVALDEAIEPRLVLALGRLRRERDAAARAVVVGRADLAGVAGAVVGARVDRQQAVRVRETVDEAQVAAAVHVLPAGEDVDGNLDALHAREDRALLVDGPVVRDQARLDGELLLGAVEHLRLRAGADRLGRGLAGEPLADEALVVEAVVPEDVAVGVGRRVADDDRVEVRRLERGAEQRGDGAVAVAVQRDMAVAPRLLGDPLDDVVDVLLLAQAQQAQRAAALAAPAHVGVHARVAVVDVLGRGRAPVRLHVDHGRIAPLAVAGQVHVADEVDPVTGRDGDVGHLRVGRAGGGGGRGGEEDERGEENQRACVHVRTHNAREARNCPQSHNDGVAGRLADHGADDSPYPAVRCTPCATSAR